VAKLHMRIDATYEPPQTALGSLAWIEGDFE
jgi:hypothetical protein